MVMSLEVVTPSGEIIRTLPVPRHASGPDLTMLYLGSEGTLGVITEVTLKVHPQPEAREFRAYIFKDFHTALEAGAELMRSRLNPCAIRLYDETETKTHVSKVFGIDLDKGAYLVFGFDGRKDIVASQMKYAREIMEKKFKGKDLDAATNELLEPWQLKYTLPGVSIMRRLRHCITGGYSAGYYSYKWAEVLAADAYSRFQKEGALNRSTGQKFRNEILSKGDGAPAAELYRNFMGREPNPDALLQSQGLCK
jgi:hypothetical protein